MRSVGAQAEEDDQSITDYLEQAVMAAQVMGEVADQGLLGFANRLQGVHDWRDLRLPSPLVKRIEDFESRRGPVPLIHYVKSVDNVPVEVLADARVDSRPEETVVFSYSETTITVQTQEAVAHTVVCRWDA